MSIIPSTRSKKARVLERLARGESVNAIASAEDTSREYIYKVKWMQKRERSSSENASPSISTPTSEYLHPVGTATTGKPPLEPTISGPSLPGIESGAFPLEAPLEDTVSDEIRLHTAETRNHLAIAKQRLTLAHENLQLSIEDRRVREELQETQLRRAIFNICPDPRSMFSNRNLYTQAMLTILENVEPFRTVYRLIVDDNKACGLWGRGQTDASMLNACLGQSFSLIDTFELNTHSSRTLLRDHVGRFLDGIMKPPGYCIMDSTPVLPCGVGWFCAMGHSWIMTEPNLIRKIRN